MIASQAVISGAFSLTRQAVQLGQIPRLKIVQTSSEAIGQIYIPLVNWALMVATILLVLGFGSSSNLAGAYGVAITTTMVITTLLAYLVARERWGWRRRWLIPLTVFLLAVDGVFFGANLLKIPDGGWFPLLVAAGVYVLMSTWRRGRELLALHVDEGLEPLDELLLGISRDPPVRVPGTAAFLTGHRRGTPPILIHHLRHNRVLHERVVLVSVVTEEVPRVPVRDRLEIKEYREGFVRIVIHYGFQQTPDIPGALRAAHGAGVDLHPDDITYYLGGVTLLPTKRVPGMALWRERLFALMSRNATPATGFFRIPPQQVVELGMQVEI